MTSWTALTTLTGRTAADRLAEAVETTDPAPTGIGVFEVEDGSGLWEVGAYFDAPPDAVALDLLAAAQGARAFAVSEIPDTDWVAKVRRELAPVEAGRFFVYGSHDADKVPEARVALLIEAAMAFGTGHHGTTIGCLAALDRLVSDAHTPRSVADIGCGTGVLAMAAARVWPITVLASDNDPTAVEVAETNVAENGLTGYVTCFEAEGLDDPRLSRAQPFDLIFANILKGPLIGLAPEMGAAIGSGGRAILSGLLDDQAEEVIAVYASSGFAVEWRDSVNGWTTLTLLRT